MKHTIKQTLRLMGLAVAAAAALMTACTQVTSQPEIQVEETPGLELSINAFPGDQQPGTRTRRDETGHISWSPKEQISMFYGGGGQYAGEEQSLNGGWIFTSTNVEQSDRVTFTGTLTAFSGTIEDAEQLMFYGVYPYNERNAFDGKYLTTEIPAEQVAAEGTFADGQFISIGRSTGLSMGFYNLCGGIKFFLQRDDVRRIILRGNRGDEVLAGRVIVDLDENGIPYVMDVPEGNTEIVLTPPDGVSCFSAGVDYFLITRPLTFEEGFNVTFERMDGSTYTRVIESSLTINRSKFQWSEYPLDYESDYPDERFPEEHCDIMDPGARAYIEDVDYSDDPGYTYTKIRDYSGSDKPQPATFTWDGTASRVFVSTTTDFADAQEYSVSASPLEVYNLIPGVRYYYQVVDEEGALVKQACLIPDGPLRMIKSATRNFRDLGGWVGEDGRSVRYGLLYRGAKPSTSDKSLFEELGISVELDLSGNAGNFTEIYEKLLVKQFLNDGTGGTSDLYKEAIRLIINWLKEGRAVFFHCLGGADRTGTLAFLIEALVGVSESDLSKDFELTSFYASRDRTDDSGRYPFKKLIQFLRSGEFGSSADSMQTLVTNWALSDQYGSPLTSENIQELKNLLLE